MDLSRAKAVNLLVSTLPLSWPHDEEVGQAWCLDICCDYFTTLNPFLHKLRTVR